MLIIPAIDILNGKVVRLKQGNFSEVTEFSRTPIEQAKFWQTAGADLLHLVDLDGAKCGQAINSEIILEIIRELKIPVQIGGGIRSYQTAINYLNAGAARIILGSSAIFDPTLIFKLIAEYGSSRISVGIDLKNSQIAVNGWLQQSNKKLEDLLSELRIAGVEQLVVTDTQKDGLQQGPNFDLLERFKDFEIIISGGVSSISDLQRIAAAKIKGAIIGKALYAGSLNIPQIRKAIRPRSNLCRRIIPCLDIANGFVVKGENFKNLKVIGEPLRLAKNYSQQLADEIAILDITATVDGKENLLKTSKNICTNVDIPITVGGGVRDISDIRDLLRAGADKVCIGTAAILNPQIVATAAKEFGAQAIVVSLDCIKATTGDWLLKVKSGTEVTSIRAIDFAKQITKLGAGELLVNSIDQDGTGSGCDLKLLATLRTEVNVPIIASSGIGKPKDFLDVFELAAADAALAAGVFHRKEILIPELKKYLQDSGVSIRC